MISAEVGLDEEEKTPESTNDNKRKEGLSSTIMFNKLLEEMDLDDDPDDILNVHKNN